MTTVCMTRTNLKEGAVSSSRVPKDILEISTQPTSSIVQEEALKSARLGEGTETMGIESGMSNKTLEESWAAACSSVDGSGDSETCGIRR